MSRKIPPLHAERPASFRAFRRKDRDPVSSRKESRPKRATNDHLSPEHLLIALEEGVFRFTKMFQRTYCGWIFASSERRYPPPCANEIERIEITLVMVRIERDLVFVPDGRAPIFPPPAGGQYRCLCAHSQDFSRRPKRTQSMAVFWWQDEDLRALSAVATTSSDAAASPVLFPNSGSACRAAPPVPGSCSRVAARGSSAQCAETKTPHCWRSVRRPARSWSAPTDLNDRGHCHALLESMAARMVLSRTSRGSPLPAASGRPALGRYRDEPDRVAVSNERQSLQLDQTKRILTLNAAAVIDRGAGKSPGNGSMYRPPTRAPAAFAWRPSQANRPHAAGIYPEERSTRAHSDNRQPPRFVAGLKVTSTTHELPRICGATAPKRFYRESFEQLRSPTRLNLAAPNVD